MPGGIIIPRDTRRLSRPRVAEPQPALPKGPGILARIAGNRLADGRRGDCSHFATAAKRCRTHAAFRRCTGRVVPHDRVCRHDHRRGRRRARSAHSTRLWTAHHVAVSHRSAPLALVLGLAAETRWALMLPDLPNRLSGAGWSEEQIADCIAGILTTSCSPRVPGRAAGPDRARFRPRRPEQASLHAT